MTDNARGAGQPVISCVRKPAARGTHICLSYSDDQEWAEALDAFVSTGLTLGERSLYRADRAGLGTATDLFGAGDMRTAVCKGHLVAADTGQSALQPPASDPGTAIEGMRTPARMPGHVVRPRRVAGLFSDKCTAPERNA